MIDFLLINRLDIVVHPPENCGLTIFDRTDNQNTKFIATKSADYINLAKCAAQNLSRIANRIRPGLVPKTIVDLLEIVDVREGQYQRRSSTLSTHDFELLLGEVYKTSSIVQAS